MEDRDKHIDEGWKETIKKAKEDVESDKQTDSAEADFSFFITTLGLQASIALGQIPNPATNKKEENRKQAKLIIDTLGLLQDKTKGNLTPDESKLLDSLLYELRMHYVSKAKDG